MNDINKCSLCGQNEANQTGSHILPFSLIKETINEEGKSQRDFEIAYSMSNSDFASTYFGRNVTPGKIMKEIGKEMSEADIVHNNNPFVKDNFLCTFCEQRLGKLENEFKSAVYDSIEDQILLSNEKDSNENILLQLGDYERNVFYLLAYSIFWRCSVTNYGGFNLRPEIQENLRQVLNDGLKKEQKELSSHLKVLEYTDFKYPLFVCYLMTPQNENQTENIVRINHTKIPYYIWLNRMVLQLYARPRQVGASVEYFFGLSRYMNIKEWHLYNKSKGSFSIKSISNERRKEVLGIIYKSYAEDQLKLARSLFIEVYKSIFNKRPDESLIPELVKTFIAINENEQFKYSRKTYVKATYIVLKKHYPKMFIEEVI